MVIEKDRKLEYWLSDIESGHWFQVTKEQHEGYLRAWEAAKPKFVGEYKSRPLIFGTGGDMKDLDNLKEMFLNPEKFKIIDFPNKEDKDLFITVIDPYADTTGNRTNEESSTRESNTRTDI